MPKRMAGLLLLFLLAFGNLPRSLAAHEIFHEPRIDGVRVDWCLQWGESCGQPAADEFCRRRGFKHSLTFEVTHGAGPTLILSSGKTCANCSAFSYVVCAPANQAPERNPAERRGSWGYEVLAKGKVIEASGAGAPLLELNSIDVKGFRAARIFVHVMEFSPEREWKLTKDAKLRVEGVHNIQGGSYPYFEGEIPMRSTTYLSGWVEIPIVGPDLKIVVWGDHLPKSKVYVDCTMYVLD